VTKLNFQEVEKLIKQLVIPLYEVKRDMRLPIDNHRDENSAEHSWSLALLAGALAKKIDPTLDIGRVCQLAVVHDLLEVYAGDTSIWDEQKISSKKAREAKAVKKIEASFAEFPWIIAMIKEYEAQKTPEAKFVNAVDKYLAIAVRYISEQSGGKFYKDKKVTREMYRKGVERSRQKVKSHPGLIEPFEEVLEKSLNSDWFYKL